MRQVSKERLIAISVQIEFEDGPVSFTVPCGATLADISENLDRIGKWHRGSPLSIDIHFKAQEEGTLNRFPAHPLIRFPISQPRRAPDFLRRAQRAHLTGPHRQR